jgi:hypothetical protein
MEPQIRQHLSFGGSVGAILLLGSGLTHAIFNGTIDGNLHPSVGMSVLTTA